MIPHPFDRYELAKTHHEQRQRAAELARRAEEATAERPQRAARVLARIGSLPVLWLKALGKALSALSSSRTPSPQKVPASHCQKSAARALNHACVQPGSARHPHEGALAGHIPCHSRCVPGHVG